MFWDWVVSLSVSCEFSPPFLPGGDVGFCFANGVFADLQIEHILKCFLGAVIRWWAFAAIISRPLNSFYHHPLVVFSSGVRGLSALVLQYYYFLSGKRLAPYLEKSQHSILVAERLCDIFYAFLFSMVYLSVIFLFDSEVFLVILFARIFLGFMLVRFESFTLRLSVLSDHAPA